MAVQANLTEGNRTEARSEAKMMRDTKSLGQILPKCTANPRLIDEVVQSLDSRLGKTSQRDQRRPALAIKAVKALYLSTYVRRLSRHPAYR